MFAAIYYPHTAIRDENFLKHALLYWDEIEYISPFHGYDVLLRYPKTVIQELAKFTKPHIPSEEEKRNAHDQIMAMVSGDLPSWLQVDRTSSADDHRLYSMFSGKLLPETWEELQKRRFVKFEKHGDFSDYASHTYLGLTMMAILARCCAGSLKHTITDQNDSYYSLLKHLQFLSGEHESADLSQKKTHQTFARWLTTLGSANTRRGDTTRETLVSITLDVIDAKKLSVENLVTLRQDKTSFAAELRQNYARSVQEYVDKMADPNLSRTDSTALVDDFRQKMEQDLNRLRAELKLNALKTVLSKEVAVAVAAPLVGSSVLVASGAGSVLGGALGIAALGKLAVEYRSGRNSVLQKHPMSFLYASKGIRLY
jgi:hypothetical protein